MSPRQRTSGMSLHELQAIIRRVSYKPGVTLSVVSSSSGPTLLIERYELDATRKLSGKIPIFFSQLAPPIEYLTEERFLDFVYVSLRETEIHELDEWFQIDGVAPYYPHEEPRLPSVP